MPIVSLGPGEVVNISLIHNMWAPYFHKKQVESHPFFPRFPVTCWDIDGWNQVSHCRHPKSTHLGNQVMQHSRVEGLMLGSVLAALGDGLVIPKMQAAAGWGDGIGGNPWIQIGAPICTPKKSTPRPPIKHRGGYCKNATFWKRKGCIQMSPDTCGWFCGFVGTNSLPKEFAQSFPKHELPRLVSSWAPVEASFVLTTFGVLAGLASPESGTSSIQGSLEMGLRFWKNQPWGFIVTQNFGDGFWQFGEWG